MSGEERVYKVVLTGFGPFRDVAVNESWLAVSGLWDMEWPSQIKLITRELPVAYDIVKEQVNKLWDEEKPDLIIHVGVSMGSTTICVEKQSFNTCYSGGDINDKCPPSEICINDGLATLETKLSVEKLCSASNEVFKSHNLKASCEVSLDPGRYLCGFSYYISLNHDDTKSLFVHVPGVDCCSVKESSLALRSIVFEALKQLYGFNLGEKL